MTALAVGKIKLDQGTGIIAIWRIDFNSSQTESLDANSNTNATAILGSKKSFHVCLLGFHRNTSVNNSRILRAGYLSLDGSTALGKHRLVHESKTMTVILERNGDNHDGELGSRDKWVKLQLEVDSQLSFATLSCIESSSISAVKVVPVGNRIKLDILNSMNTINPVDASSNANAGPDSLISPWYQIASNSERAEYPSSSFATPIEISSASDIEIGELKIADQVIEVPEATDITTPVIAVDTSAEFTRFERIVKCAKSIWRFVVELLLVAAILFILTVISDSFQNGLTIRTLLLFLVYPVTVLFRLLLDVGNWIHNRFLRKFLPLRNPCATIRQAEHARSSVRYSPIHVSDINENKNGDDESSLRPLSAGVVEKLYRVDAYRENFLSGWWIKVMAPIVVCILAGTISARLGNLSVSPPRLGFDNFSQLLNQPRDAHGDSSSNYYSIFRLDERSVAANFSDHRVLNPTTFLGFVIRPLILVRLINGNFSSTNGESAVKDSTGNLNNFNAWLLMSSSKYDNLVTEENGGLPLYPKSFTQELSVMQFNQLQLYDSQEIKQVELAVSKIQGIGKSEKVENHILELIDLNGLYWWKFVSDATYYVFTVATLIFILLHSIFWTHYVRIWAAERELSGEFHARAEQLARTTLPQ